MKGFSAPPPRSTGIWGFEMNRRGHIALLAAALLTASPVATGDDFVGRAPSESNQEERIEPSQEADRVPARYLRRRGRPIARRSGRVVYRSSPGPYWTPRARKRWGFDVGFLMEKQNSNGALLGLAYSPGARVAFFFPMGSAYAIKPSFGYFRRSDGTASVGVTENRFELGANLLYAPRPRSKAAILAGLATRMDVNLTKISAFEDSDTAMSLSFRLGPTVGTELLVGGANTLTIELDLTFDVGNAFRLHPALTMGLRFPL